MVGIAIQEVDDHLMADARDMNHAPFFASPRCADANPAATIFVFLADTIPLKLHFHLAVFVGVNLFARRANDNGRLWA